MNNGMSQPLDEHDETAQNAEAGKITKSRDNSVDSANSANSAGSTQSDVCAGDCFDPASCCDPREQVMIAAMKAYLRPEEAPECLYEKLKLTLDRCCGEMITEHTVITSHTIIHHRHREDLN